MAAPALPRVQVVSNGCSLDPEPGVLSEGQRTWQRTGLAEPAQTSCVHCASEAQWHRLTDWKRPHRISGHSGVRHRSTRCPHSKKGSQVEGLRSEGQLSQSIPERVSPPDMGGREGRQVKAQWVPVTGLPCRMPARPALAPPHAHCMAHPESDLPRALPARVGALPTLCPAPLHFTAYASLLLKQLQGL